MTVRETLAKDWPVILILLLPFILLLSLWDRIPDEIALHWNARGEVDRWGEKGWEAFILPAASVGVYALLLFLPYIDPKKKAESQQKALRAFRIVLPVLFAGFFILVLLQWLGYAFSVSNAIYLGVGLLFLIMGNYMQAIKPNYFIGIRTPWTLESEEIWRKTHRLGGKVWIIGALAMIVLWFFVPEPSYSTFFFVGVIAIALIPTAYSFYLYLKDRPSTGSEEMD